MKQTAKRLLWTCGIAISAIVVPLSVAPPAWAAEKHPFMVSSSPNAPTPFDITLPATTEDGKAVKTVAIDFVAGDCDAPAGTSLAGAALATVTFNGQFGYYYLAFTPGQQFPNVTEFVMTQQTTIFADPGSTIDFGLTGTGAKCTIVFSGHLLLK